MMFVLRMAVRETRSSWRRLLFFFVCIAVGVAAIVALRSVIQSVRSVFGTEAKALIAADVVIGTNRDWPAGARETIDRRLGEAGATTRTETIETPTMVRPADGRPIAKMAELRAVQSAFPLYGNVVLQKGQTYSHALLQQHGAIVRPEVLTTFGVNVGDQIAIGQTTFTIRGILVKEPGRGMGGFSLGPRILIDYDDVPSTGLLGFGSRAQRQLLVQVPEERIESLVRTLRADLRQDFINTRSYRSNEDQIGRDFDRAEDYLSLVGLVIVILGGIAVSSVTRVFILQKIRSIAVLKCLGARNPQIITVYILQVMTPGCGVCSASPSRVRRSRRFRCSSGGRRHRCSPTCIMASPGAPPRRASASACWCLCCFRWCRCCRCVSSSHRCCCGTRPPGGGATGWAGPSSRWFRRSSR
jgi:putative ABC transport system permease protein